LRAIRRGKLEQVGRIVLKPDRTGSAAAGTAYDDWLDREVAHDNPKAIAFGRWPARCSSEQAIAASSRFYDSRCNGWHCILPLGHNFLLTGPPPCYKPQRNMHSAISEQPGAPRRRGLILDPTYGYGDLAPRKPTLREVFVEWLDAINFLKDRTRVLPAVYLAYHLATFGMCILFFSRYFSLASVGIVMGIAPFIAWIYNTVWYHRYCSHRAFRFRSLWSARLLLWTNPVCFREEGYVIPHRIHHLKSDKPGDPYGPHLGWLGSYLAPESLQKTNRDITRSEYERLARGLEHIGFVQNSYENFRRTGSVEDVWHYGARVMVATLFWCSLGYVVAGWRGAMAWLASVFLCSFVIRDFNYRGHGGFFFKASEGYPANQFYYGVLAGEWHDNHHEHPRSARAGLAWWQLDVPYWIIKGMGACGLVDRINLPERTCHARSLPRDPLPEVHKPL
jgi:sn-1 stearoyl-lipid 9-desaturase